MLCKDCEHYSQSISGDKCMHEAAVDVIRGEKQRTCEEMRGNQNLCGLEGRWFRASISRFTPPPPPTTAA